MNQTTFPQQPIEPTDPKPIEPTDPIPVAPKDPNQVEPQDPNSMAFTCRKCGIKVQQIMSYFCPQNNCPVGLGSKVSF